MALQYLVLSKPVPVPIVTMVTVPVHLFTRSNIDEAELYY